MHTNAQCIFILKQVMKQWLSQVSSFLSLGHTVSEQCSKIPSFPFLSLRLITGVTRFILVGIKICDTETPCSPFLLTSASSQKTQDLGGAAQHLEGLIIKKAL